MSFSDDIRAFSVKCANNSDQVVRKTVMGVATSLIMKSPVGNPALWKSKPPKGYAGGTFRANWQLGIGSIAPGTLKEHDTSGGPTISKIATQMPQKAAGGVFYIGNNLPYGPALEDGHSTQAPHGFVALTAVEFGGIVNQAVGGLK